MNDPPLVPTEKYSCIVSALGYIQHERVNCAEEPLGGNANAVGVIMKSLVPSKSNALPLFVPTQSEASMFVSVPWFP
jgi:hypothetical protein